MSRACASSSGPSSSSVVSSKKYDVFLSFRGEDTRNNFTGHLYEALCQKNVITFKDDPELEKGDDISPALIEAIEESHVFIVIFSENFAFSKWCLRELNKSLECKKGDQGQIVIPVFHNIDPSHVRKQTGSYAQAFAKHKRDSKLSKDELQKLKAALTEAANLSGWDSRNRIESDLIKDIVKDVLQKLNLRYPYEVKGLVGIEKMYEQIESLLKIRPNDARILGIWGMGGIGKTTLATALHAKLSPEFDGHCLLTDVREDVNRYGPNVVRNKLFSSLLEGEDLHLDAHCIDIPFLMKRLERKKVFIVLDDVATSEQIEDLILKNYWLGPGSRVIVTTRDKHILNQVEECEIYEVKELNKHDSLQLFRSTTFGKRPPPKGYEDLSRRAIAYCKGNPLALKVLGRNLCSRRKEFWESELKKLQDVPNKEIHDVLKLSYDDLDRDQSDIFLEIACFFKGRSRDSITRQLETYGLHAESGIEVLLDKALITISNTNTIDMHDLIQEMGQEIVSQESKDPGKRSRVFKTEEGYDLLKKNKGTEVVKGIRFDSSKVGDLHLSSNSFKRMTNLRYLEIYQSHCGNRYNMCFPDGLEWLSDELRFLHWETCSLKSLPSTFCAEMLVKFRMPSSKLEKLWDGLQNFVNLKEIDLEDSKELIELPDLSLARSLESVYLVDCESLRQLHPSIVPLPKLTNLCLRGCEKIESLKTSFHSKSLCTVNLNGCFSLTEFSVTSEEMEELDLRGTAIRESSSIWRNSKLNTLQLSGCDKLDIVGNKLSNDLGLGYLTQLDLECTQINASNLCFILDGTPSLKWLCLIDCYNLEAVPDNIQNQSMLEELFLDDCRNLVSLPELPPSLKVLSAINCTSLDRDSTQRLVLMIENWVQRMSYLLEYQNDFFYASFILPGDQIPSKLGFHTTTGASITIPPILKSNLRGFIFCFILSESTDSVDILYDAYEQGVKVVDSGFINGGTLSSDHMLLCWKGFKKQVSGGDHYNLSFEFKCSFYREGRMPYYSKEGIKGCGVFPVYDKSNTDDIDDESNDIDDELQPRRNANGVGVGGSDNEENENDREQLLIPAQIEKENFNDTSSCDCFIGLLLRHLLGEPKQ